MQQSTQGGLRAYLRSRDFRYTVIAILVFFGIMLLVAFLWLKFYTHHGQELELPDYKGYQYEEAVRHAKKNKFRMSIQDSIHILNKPGGEIIKQNPDPGTLVKQHRMIYVTITKRSPDKILSGRLPEMYGKNYERKKRELSEHFEIQSRIADTRFDPGDPGQVLEVRYKGKIIIDARGRNNDVQIEKGDVLDFIISTKAGGKVEIPNLVCKTYEEAQFLLENLGLRVGNIIEEGTISSLQSAYVVAQLPSADGSIIDMESSIQLTVSTDRPSPCN